MPSFSAISRASRHAVIGRIRSRHADAGDVFFAHGFHRDHRGQRRIDAAAQADQHLRKSALADIIARAQHQRLINSFAFVGEIFMTIAGAGIEIHQHQVFFKGSRRGDHFARAVHRETGAVEHQLIVAAHLVHIDHRRW